ncbi:hypothetical protein [Arthrobacter sp. A5]|uniref:hypothetical protein n=1 Tax=Arthrobacter sp. A5 TaxID=576926 RepID=UPI003DA91BFA
MAQIDNGIYVAGGRVRSAATQEPLAGRHSQLKRAVVISTEVVNGASKALQLGANRVGEAFNGVLLVRLRR